MIKQHDCRDVIVFKMLFTRTKARSRCFQLPSCEKRFRKKAPFTRRITLVPYHRNKANFSDVEWTKPKLTKIEWLVGLAASVVLRRTV